MRNTKKNCKTHSSRWLGDILRPHVWRSEALHISSIRAGVRGASGGLFSAFSRTQSRKTGISLLIGLNFLPLASHRDLSQAVVWRMSQTFHGVTCMNETFACRLYFPAWLNFSICQSWARLQFCQTSRIEWVCSELRSPVKLNQKFPHKLNQFTFQRHFHSPPPHFYTLKLCEKRAKSKNCKSCDCKDECEMHNAIRSEKRREAHANLIRNINSLFALERWVFGLIITQAGLILALLFLFINRRLFEPLRIKCVEWNARPCSINWTAFWLFFAEKEAAAVVHYKYNWPILI